MVVDGTTVSDDKVEGQAAVGSDVGFVVGFRIVGDVKPEAVDKAVLVSSAARFCSGTSSVVVLGVVNWGAVTVLLLKVMFI